LLKITTLDSSQQTYIAKTIAGLEEILAAELIQLGAQDVKTIKRAVSFTGNTQLLYKANLWCRTALRILKPLFTFPAATNEQLYKGIYEYDWEKIFSIDNTFAIDSVVNDSSFTHSHFVSQKVKDAIADRFRSIGGSRPTVNIENPDIRINIHIYKDVCDVSLDSSGESLHKRGYRVAGGLAPLSEVLAAGLILLSDWDGKRNFIDTMCGSGTIVIEAALIAQHIAPGSFRKSFSFMNWKDFDASLWNELKRQAVEQQTESSCRISGSDIEARAIRNTRGNVISAGMQKSISLQVAPFSEFKAPEGGGVMIINPPYGERMVEDDIVAFYKSIGDALKKNYHGYDAWIISSDMNALKFLGLKPTRKIAIFNGPLECRYMKFGIYEGSKRTKFNQQ
jgi:putative N6-adenine-specific DNA methylase